MRGLKTISLPRATITAAEFVAAGALSLGRGGLCGSAAPLTLTFTSLDNFRNSSEV